MRYQTAFLALATVFGTNLLNIGFGVYETHPNIDIPLHLAGGFAAAMLAIAVHDDFKHKHKIGRTPRWYDLLFTLGFVSLIAIVWEFHEFIIDRSIVLNYAHAVTQLSVADTIGDFLNGLIGATVGFFIFGRNQKKTTVRE